MTRARSHTRGVEPTSPMFIGENATTRRMADRTLVAYDRDAGYDLHYAHDGVTSAALDETTPFGGTVDRDLDALRERLEPLGIDVELDAERSAVDPTPLATGVAWQAVVAGLDYGAYDRCLRVDTSWNVTRYLVCFFGLGHRGGEARDPVGDGALLRADEHEEPYVRGWFEGVKSTVADACRCGVVDEDDARSYMAGRVTAFADGRDAHVGF